MTRRRITGAASLTPRRWFVPAFARRADRDPLETLVSRDRLAGDLGGDADGDALADVDLLPVESEHARPAHVDVDLLLVRLSLVVLEAFGARRQIEVVHAKRRHPECSPHLLDHAIELVQTRHVVLRHVS